MRRVLVVVVSTISAVAALLAPVTPVHAAGHEPIVFVHGWNSSGATWDTMKSRFAADGWSSGELKAWTYNTAQSNATTASHLAAVIDDVRAQTGAAQVDLVTHSMGGLSSRYYLKNLDSAGKVDDWVSLGGPNHGTQSANGCFQTSCVEMRPGSTFLKNLNQGDETPGAFHYGTFWSSCDGVIFPADSTVLTGATNTNVGCLTHSELHENAGVYAQVRSFVQ
jgi:triacylglycerol esterase/lipase EstA (alpha/beta hydrolase family)